MSIRRKVWRFDGVLFSGGRIYTLSSNRDIMHAVQALKRPTGRHNSLRPWPNKCYTLPRHHFEPYSAICLGRDLVSFSSLLAK